MTGPEGYSEFCSVAPELSNLPFRNPDNFVAGQVHQHIHAWESILGDSPTHQLISDRITNKADVERFLVPFRGKFKGVFYECPFPPSKVFPNNPTCKKYSAFITETLLQRIGVKWEKLSLRTLCFPLQLNLRSLVCARMPDF